MRSSTYNGVKWHFEVLWAALAKRPVAFISENEVREQLRQIIDRHGKVAAIRARASLNAFYCWAMREGIAKTNPVINSHTKLPGEAGSGNFYSVDRDIWYLVPF
jgi:hypothetical protein